MNEADRDVAVHWVRLALGDLAVAERPGEPSEAWNRLRAEHAQQAGEKALKAVIVLIGADPPKTHDLIELARLAGPGEGLPGLVTPTRLAALTDAASARYPDALDAAYTTDEVDSLHAAAATIVNWARERVINAGADASELTPR